MNYLEYRINEDTLKRFKEKYYDHIVKEFDDRILMHCIFPNHQDNKRSGVFYINRGIFHCAACGGVHVNKILSGVEYEPQIKINKEYLPINWDFDKHPLHYKIDGDSILAINANNNNNDIVGDMWRIQQQVGRMYGALGKPGFRLFAPIITESFTDAITLLENGINAGSICSVNNWKNCKGRVYVPQYDAAGIKCAKKIAKGNTIIFNWYESGYKDIREMPEHLLQKKCIINLGAYKL